MKLDKKINEITERAIEDINNVKKQIERDLDYVVEKAKKEMKSLIEIVSKLPPETSSLIKDADYIMQANLNVEDRDPPLIIQTVYGHDEVQLGNVSQGKYKVVAILFKQK